MINNIDIMAPAGSYEALRSAINAGAGSIYFGAGRLNMRSKSSKNFTFDDFTEIANICKDNNVRTYLTVNTVMYDEDLEEMRSAILHAKKTGISAIIASDISAISYARTIDMEVHISTQLNVSNFEAIKFFSQFADVIVLARELNIEQVKYISDKIIEEQIKGPNGQFIRLEMFVHGALCMSVSGKCYLSLHDNTQSANRGACLQNCRRAYIVKEKGSEIEYEIDNEYIMSPKDLCTISFLDKIIDAGVTVLKIEGRGRSADYVKRTVEVYNKAVEAYYNNDFTEENTKIWTEELATVFNRGFWNGYYLGAKLGEWNDKYGSKATKRKRVIGKITNFFTKAGVAEIWLHSEGLSVGDEILITGPTTGAYEAIVKEIRHENKPVSSSEKGWTISIPVSEKIRRNDKLFIVEDSKKD